MPLQRLVGFFALVAALAATAGGQVLAAPGDLDRSFGRDGKVTSNFTGRDDGATALVIEEDGMIVVAGAARLDSPHGPKFALERLRPNGTLDPTFGTGGRVVTDFPTWFGPSGAASALAIQPDGKIVAAGGAGDNFALARYRADGTLDSTFGDGGKVTTAFPGFSYGAAWGFAMAIQADGKIVVGGNVYPTGTLTTGAFALARYNPDGTLDSSFDGDGRVVTDMSSGADQIEAVAIQVDGRIIAAGRANSLTPDSEFALARYESDGTLDPTFGDNGRLTTNFTGRNDGALDMLIQPDGKIVAGGVARVKFALARYEPDGDLDGTFGGDGKVTTDFTTRVDYASGLALQPTGRIVAAGFASVSGGRFALARYNADGTLDTSFSWNGKTTTDFTRGSDRAQDVALQANGRIVAAGRAARWGGRFALARYR